MVAFSTDQASKSKRTEYQQHTFESFVDFPVHDEEALDSLRVATVGSAQIELADSLTRYEEWPTPTVIVADGPYGLAAYPGDPPTVDDLPAWYAPHAAAWSKFAAPSSTLWFWSSELAWATVHSVLVLHGWKYRALHVWDKGIGHIAGNVNSRTIRGFPVVTEVCVQYVKDSMLTTGTGDVLVMRDWLRAEWLRSGLPLSATNEACGVRNAATRKYFTKDHLWYFPPPDMMERLSEYANKNGLPTDWPYFSLDGVTHLTACQWSTMRAKWSHAHGITNVWSEPAVRGTERLKDFKAKTAHANQKPLQLMERIVHASSDPGDVVWEPFGGLCTAAVASLRLGRRCYSAEINPEFYRMAESRLNREIKELKDVPNVAS